MGCYYQFYHPDDIKTAKTLLCGVDSDILPETHDRRDSYVGAAHEKETSEIIDAMLKNYLMMNSLTLKHSI